jgi:hypothetical protein
MAEPTQSAAPSPAQGTSPSSTVGTAPVPTPAQTTQPPNPIGGANIQNQAVNPEAIKLEIARRLLQTHLGGVSANNDVARTPQVGINLPPGVPLNPNVPGPHEQAQLSAQPSAFQPIAPTPTTTAPQNSYQPFSSNPTTQTAPQPSATSSTSSGFFATSTNQTASSTQASSPGQPSQTQQSQSTPGFLNSASSPQTQQTALQPAAPAPTTSQPAAASQTPSTPQASQSPSLSPQQQSPMGSLVTPPSGSLASGSHAGFIQSILASMNQQNSMAQIHAVLIQTPTAPAAPVVSQTVQIQPTAPSASFQSAPLLQASSVTNQPTSASSQQSNREAAPAEPAQRAAPTTRESTPASASSSNTTNPTPEQHPAAQTPRSEPSNRPPAPPTSAEIEAALRAITGQPAGLPSSTAPAAPAAPELAPRPTQSSPPPISPPQSAERTSSPTVEPRETPPAATNTPAQPSIQPATPSLQATQQQPANNDTRLELKPDPNQNLRHQEQPLQPSPSLRETLITIPSPQRPISEISIQPLPYKPDQPISVPPEQAVQQQQQQRIERLRDMQQILAAEREPSKPMAERIARDPEPQTTARQEQTNVAVERVRESILDKLTNIQSRIEAASTERQRLDDVRGPRDTRIQGRDTLVRPDPIHHDAKPSLITKLAERLHENQSDVRVVRDSITGLASATALERVRARHIDSTSPLLGSRATSSTQPLGRANPEGDKLSNLIDLLKRFSQRSVNFSLLNKMDTSLEKACLTIVTGAALGYLGLEILYRASTLVVLHTLASLRDEEQPEPEATSDDDQENLEQQLVEDLEEFTTAELSTVGEQGFVVDLAGIVVAAHSGEPLAHVEVNCSEFGSCHTDSEGRFLFPNIPLGTPYTISVSSNHLNLKPLVITGVCGELEFLTIRVQVA